MDKSSQKKPKWLRRLEQESWQAELVISGLLIVGTLQIPTYIDYFVDWCLVYFSPERYDLIGYFFLYLHGIVIFLIFLFLVHFILRTIWVGLLGLNSVFPKGINYETENYSAVFLKRLEEKFPNNQEDILSLERACSMMFGFATMFAIVMIMININIIILATLRVIASTFLPESVISAIGVALLSFLGVIFPLLSFILSSKRFHSNEKIQHFYFNISDGSGRILGTFLYYPITRISYIFATNGNSKKYGFGIMMIFFMVGIISSFKMNNSNMRFFRSKSDLTEYFSDTTKVIAAHYESYHNGEEKILSAVLPSEKIYGNSMKVFVPVFRNEEAIMEDLCGAWKNDSIKEKSAKRQAKRLFWLECAHQYHRFYLNNQPISVQLSTYWHPNQGEKGVLTFLPTDGCKLGKNMLRIEKIKSEEEIYRTINVPFWFFGQ